ncbi:MAG: 30S ribosome-binding factor RbfA [Actinobacteria bacterium]|nr:30S ribosome-binding factor RbfA [Actinomycetota bacterium]
MSRSDRMAARRYPRMARVNELLREILGDALERLDVDELAFVTITGVECSADLRHATVYFDAPLGAMPDDELLASLGEVRVRLQRAIATEARLKRTPELQFVPDPAVRSGEQIDAMLRDVVGPADEPAPDDDR